MAPFGILCRFSGDVFLYCVANVGAFFEFKNFCAKKYQGFFQVVDFY